MRTLVISDLHLGMRYERDVLRRRAPLDILLDALADVDRLVLLGDVVELSDHNPEDALAAVAAPVLRALGRRLGPHREVILVPGNHESALRRSMDTGDGRPALGRQLGTAGRHA